MEKFAKYIKIGVICILLSTVFLIWAAVFELNAYAGKLFLDVFDVGQGDSIYIQVSGNQVLIDGGPGDGVLSKLGSVMPFWDRSIDLIILTHAHADHVAGLIQVLKRYKVGRVLESGEVYSTPEYHEWHELIKEKHIPVIIAERGQIIYLGEDAELDILSPFENYNGIPLKNPHDANVSAKLIFGKTSALLMGDAEKNIEYRLILESPEKLKADILKVGHHGSKTSSVQSFLNAVAPKYAVISVGRRNRYGHPHQEVLERLRALGAAIFRTDLDHDVKFLSDREELRVIEN